MKNIFLFLCFGLSNALLAQDIILKIDGSTVEAKVEEVTNKDVIYKKFKNVAGPSYHLELKEIEKITYESGAIDVFNAPKVSSPSSSYNTYDDVKDFGNNIISLNTLDILFQNITVSYERILGANRKLGIRIPLSISLYGDNNNNFNWPVYNIFYSGLDFNFYPTGQGQASLFLGPALRSGYARVTQNSFGSYGNINSAYFSFLLQGGFIWNPIKGLTVSSAFGLGSRRYFSYAPSNGNLTRTTATMNFSFGYRF